ncbi:hypothetical protein APHAL10511_006422 [Amanita phalloides]|nr:hypothetical protein APHAL10511_006422 [Amanita phalloides]
MTEYDFSPEAYDRYIANQRRIAHWVDNTELHRAEFNPATDPDPMRRTSSHDPPPRPSHRRHSSLPYPPVPHYPFPHNAAGPSLPGPMPIVPPPPRVMYVSPPRSPNSRQSHHSAATYVVAPPPALSSPYYQYPYPYAPAGYPFMGQAQAVLPMPGHANGTPQNTPYYNPHPSQPLRAPPYPPAANIHAFKPSEIGGTNSLPYGYTAPLPFASKASSPPAYGKFAQNPGAAMHYLPPDILYQRLYDIERTHERRRARSSGSSYSDDRGRSRSSSDSRNSSHSRGRSRTRKSWWNFA